MTNGPLHLVDLVDPGHLQQLVDGLTAGGGIGLGVMDLDGNLLAGAGWQDICTEFRRARPETLASCLDAPSPACRRPAAANEHVRVQPRAGTVLLTHCPERHGAGIPLAPRAHVEGNAMNRRFYRGTTVLAVALIVMALVAVSAAPTMAKTKTKRVSISSFSFTPQTITIRHGTKVVWRNSDNVPHDVTSASSMSTSATVTGLFASPTLSPGASFSYTFKKKGTYYYECTIHASMASMHGKVVVK